MSDNSSIIALGSIDAWKGAGALIVDGIRRRRLSIALVAVLFAAVGTAAAVLTPRTFVAESRLLVQRNYVMPALAHPTRSVPSGDAPTQSAVEFVMNHDALEALVRRCGLLARWDSERPTVLRWKDRALSRLSAPPSDEDKTDALIALLEKRLIVTVEGENVIVKATWTNPQTVVDITTAAVDAFLEARRKVDVQTIADTRTLLEQQANVAHAKVEEQLAGVTAAQAAASQRRAAAAALLLRHAAPAPVAARPEPAAPPAPSALDTSRTDRRQELLTRVLETKKTVADLDRRHQDAVRQLEAKLAESRAVETDRHPDIAAMQRSLLELRREPDDLADARQLEARLTAEYARLMDADTRAVVSASATAPAADAVERPASPASEDALLIRARLSDDDESDAIGYSRSILKNSVETYQDLLTRLADCEIELETAKAAFSYRYAVTSPARLPKKPSAPNAPLMVLGGLVAGIAAGALRAVFAELRSRDLLAPAALINHLSASTVRA